MFLLSNKQYICFCTALCALSLSGCMFNDQDAHDFDILMSLADSQPESQSQNNHNETDNTEKNDNTTPELPQKPLNLNDAVYTDMCQRILKCDATYKQTNTCINRYKEYVTTISNCADAAEDYYQCISGYACKTTGSCKDYVYQFNHQLPDLCAENNNYQQADYNGCLDLLCNQNEQVYSCDGKRKIYEDCVVLEYGKDKILQHSDIVESQIEQYYILKNCACFLNSGCDSNYEIEKSRICFKNLINQSNQYPKCIIFQELYYQCTGNYNATSAFYTSSHNQYAIDRYYDTCKKMDLDAKGYATIDDCVAGEVKIDRENKQFRCEEQQDVYEECMMNHYGVFPELITVRR